MAQRYRTERDGNLDPGYWNPEIGGRQGQRDESGDWGGARQDDRQWSARDRGQDRVQGRRPQQGGRSEDYRQAYDENAEGWRRSGQRQSAPPDLDYDQGWHSNADWSGEGDAVPRPAGRRAQQVQRRHQARSRGDDEGNYLGQGWEEAGGSGGEHWDRNSDLFARGGSRGYGAPRHESQRNDWQRGEAQGGRGEGARGTEGRDWEGRDWRGAQQTTGRDYFSRDDYADEYRRDYGGYVEPERAQRGRAQGQRTSPYSGSSAGYVTGEAFGGASGDESWSGEFVGRRSHRGKGPKGYARSAERIREEVCERLSDDDLVDASEISVTCREGGVLMLEGTVDSLQAKHRAEMIADQCAGVRDVESRLRVLRPERQSARQGGQQAGGAQASAMPSGAGSTGGSETGSAGRQEAQGGSESTGSQATGTQNGGSRSASSASMMAASRDADQDRQKH